MIIFKRYAEFVCLCKNRNEECLILANAITYKDNIKEEDKIEGIEIKKYNSCHFNLEGKKIWIFKDLIDNIKFYYKENENIEINGMFCFTLTNYDNCEDSILCIILCSYFLLFFSIKELSFLHFTTLEKKNYKENNIFNWFFICIKTEYLTPVLFIQDKKDEIYMYFLQEYIKSKGIRGYNKCYLFLNDYLVSIEKVPNIKTYDHLDLKEKERFASSQDKNDILFEDEKKQNTQQVDSLKLTDVNTKMVEGNTPFILKKNKTYTLYRKKEYYNTKRSDQIMVIENNVNKNSIYNKKKYEVFTSNHKINDPYSNIYNYYNNHHYRYNYFHHLKYKQKGLNDDKKNNIHIIKKKNTLNTCEILKDNLDSYPYNINNSFEGKNEKGITLKIKKKKRKIIYNKWLKQNNLEKVSPHHFIVNNIITYSFDEKEERCDKKNENSLFDNFNSRMICTYCIHFNNKTSYCVSLILTTRKCTFYIFKLCFSCYMLKYGYCIIDLSKVCLIKYVLLEKEVNEYNTKMIHIDNKIRKNYCNDMNCYRNSTLYNTNSYNDIYQENEKKLLEYYDLSNDNIKISKNYFIGKKVEDIIYTYNISKTMNKNILGIGTSMGELYFYMLSYKKEKFVCTFLNKCYFKFSLLSFLWLKNERKNLFLFQDNCNKIYIGELIINNNNIPTQKDNNYVIIYNFFIKLTGDDILFYTIPREFFCKKKKCLCYIFSLDSFFLTFICRKNKFYVLVLNLYLSPFFRYSLNNIKLNIFIHNNRIYQCGHNKKIKNKIKNNIIKNNINNNNINNNNINNNHFGYHQQQHYNYYYYYVYFLSDQKNIKLIDVVDVIKKKRHSLLFSNTFVEKKKKNVYDNRILLLQFVLIRFYSNAYLYNKKFCDHALQLRNVEELLQFDCLLINMGIKFGIIYIFKKILSACFFKRNKIVVLKRRVGIYPYQSSKQNRKKEEKKNCLCSSILIFYAIYETSIITKMSIKLIRQKIHHVFIHPQLKDILFFWSNDKGGVLYYVSLKKEKEQIKSEKNILKLNFLFQLVKNKKMSIPIHLIEWITNMGMNRIDEKRSNDMISLILLTTYYFLIFVFDNLKGEIITIQKIIKLDLRKAFLSNGLIIESLKIKKRKLTREFPRDIKNVEYNEEEDQRTDEKNEGNNKENFSDITFALSTNMHIIHLFSYNSLYNDEKVYIKTIKRKGFHNIYNKKTNTDKEKHIIFNISSNSLTYIKLLSKINYYDTSPLWIKVKYHKDFVVNKIKIKIKIKIKKNIYIKANDK
ncbi:hypothetical protein PADL01_0607800 [Plasmodium sp. gorilla clade G2]|uniref:hypothetical protein n=1 Tax=Plasmodium sp. gorilla clade G2 TaxID=880535 RepID=UPI000D225184|nr:hypothetical protein PADL01_0607800 [Plasmodium sp. gorilla clade G2]SOV12474.1 hypothetical protein PADL01_0607800 [Plasmodium sp. gorilla clade G2]